MSSSDREFSAKEIKDLKILVLFTSVYCRDHHAGPKHPYTASHRSPAGLRRYRCCSECREFLDYAIERRLRCPLPDKPSCKHCRIHCYRPGHREQVRRIMRYSGKTLIRRGRIDLLWHYLF